MVNEQAGTVARQVMTGKDAKIYVSMNSYDESGNLVAGDEHFYAEAESFNVVMNVTNVDVQPLGTMLQYAVSTAVNYSITLSEMVVTDDAVIKDIQAEIKKGKMPSFTFRAGANDWDTNQEMITFRNCIPDGSVGILNITPGEVVKREMNFRVNDVPEWLKDQA